MELLAETKIEHRVGIKKSCQLETSEMISPVVGHHIQSALLVAQDEQEPSGLAGMTLMVFKTRGSDPERASGISLQAHKANL